MTVGATIMFFFGAIWLLLGLYGGKPSSLRLRAGLLLAGLALATWIGIAGIRTARQSRSAPPPTAKQAEIERQVGRRFGWITAIEGVAIFLAVALLKAAHRSDAITSAIALIVGLHFFPLAALFGASVYHLTGLLGCAIGITGLLISEQALRSKVVGLSFGLLLWFTSAAVLLQISVLS